MVKVGDRGSDMKTEQLLELIREGFDIAEYDEVDRCIVLQSRRNGVLRFEKFAQRVIEAAQAENIALVEAKVEQLQEENIRLRDAMHKCVVWLEEDTAECGRDVSIGTEDYNDIYASIEKAQEILANAMITSGKDTRMLNK